ncbi:MAG: hypothetical protein R2911_19940 [Caldilineaceae bacterium]
MAGASAQSAEFCVRMWMASCAGRRRCWGAAVPRQLVVDAGAAGSQDGGSFHSHW